MISQNNEAWPDFKINVWKLIQAPNVDSVLSGFYILESFLKFAPGHFRDHTNDLYDFFKLGLEHENYELKLSALKCFSAYLNAIEIQLKSHFQVLSGSIFEAVYILLQTSGNEEGLETLSKMLENGLSSKNLCLNTLFGL